MNRRKSEKSPDSLLDLLIQHYDELSELVALAETACGGPRKAGLTPTNSPARRRREEQTVPSQDVMRERSVLWRDIRSPAL